MEIVLCMSTDQLLVFGKGYIALDYACANARGRFVGLLGVLGKLQRGATVTD